MSRVIYLRPSSAHAWGRCAGYAALNERVRAPIEDGDNDVREDGTACHWLASEQHASGGVWPWPFGQLSPNGREVTDELIACVEEYLDVLKSWGYGPEQRIESPLPTAAIFPGTQDGTPDAYLVRAESTRGKLADLKAGFRPVEAWRNPQLIVYGWTLFCLYPHLVDMELTIVQPRAAHREGTVRTWLVTREEMAPLAAHLQAMARNAHAPDPVCTLSDACRDCKAAHACPTKQAAALNAVEVSYDATPHELTPAQLAYELSKLEAARAHIEHRITGLTAQAEQLIRRRENVPGYALERSSTKWRWRDDKRAQVVQLGKLFGVDVWQEPKLLTVPKLRHSFPGIDVQAMCAERPTGDLRLKQIDPNEALRAFTKRKVQ